MRRYTLGYPLINNLYRLMERGVPINATATRKAFSNISDSCIITGGEFRDGAFMGGEFHGGIFHGGQFWDDCRIDGGTFHSGTYADGHFIGGNFYGGVFEDGTYYDGEFHAGIFGGGCFYGGEFRGGDFTYIDTCYGGVFNRTTNHAAHSCTHTGVGCDQCILGWWTCEYYR